MKETLITPAGRARLSGELERLKTSGRREVAERIRNAVSSEADLTESHEYLAAREEQALLEWRIARLEERLAGARVVAADAANGVVDVGERVRLRDLDSGTPHEYELVGTLEAEALSGRISAESPLGRALLGRRVGENVVVEAPKRRFRYRILGIGPPGAERHRRNDS